jgi:hypothetical protein
MTKTLKIQLEEFIKQHGLAEVLDRLADSQSPGLRGQWRTRSHPAKADQLHPAK